MKIKLNRTIGCPEITRDTPLDVIVFILNTMGKNIDRNKIETKFDKILKFINDYSQEIEIKEEYTQEELRSISSFVSDTEEPWSIETLILSFNNLLDFYNKFKFPEIRDITFGERNNDNPRNYDIVMVYILCHKLKLKTDREDTIYTMKSKILDIHRNKDEYSLLVKKNLSSMNSLELYHVSTNITKSSKEYVLEDNTKLKDLSKNINLNYIIKNSILSEEEAIIYSAKFFNYDISESKYPVDVLMSIVNKKNDVIEFNVSDQFTKKFLINPKFYKLDKFWRKNIKFLYSAKTVSTLKSYENLDEDQDLDIRFNQNNFYDGVINFRDNIQTTEDIITYGNLENNTFLEISAMDLEEEISSTLSLDKYEENAEKLVSICKDNSKKDIYSRLHKTVRYVQRFGKPIDNSSKYIMSSESKKTIKPFFEKIFEISETLKNKEKIDDIVNISLNNTLTEIVSFIEKIKDEDLKDKLGNLKFVKYQNQVFVKDTANFYPLILEDIKNMKNLKEKNKEYIDSKSKLFRDTSYYYFYLFYKENLFDIDNY